MNKEFIKFIIEMKETYKGKDLHDEKTINEINSHIYDFLSKHKKGELLVNIYIGMSDGKTQVDVARDTGISINIVREGVLKIRGLIDYLKHVGIDLPQFEKFEYRSYKFKEETIKKMDERNNIKRNR